MADLAPEASAPVDGGAEASAVTLDAAEGASLTARARTAWLRNSDVLCILRHWRQLGLCCATGPPSLPGSGTLHLFDRRQVKNFRRDGHSWQKKAGSQTVRETHEKLKIGDEPLINVYYCARADQERFHRRCYWLLGEEGAQDGMVLVHYLDTSALACEGGDGEGGAAAEAPRRPPRRAAAVGAAAAAAAAARADLLRDESPPPEEEEERAPEARRRSGSGGGATAPAPLHPYAPAATTAPPAGGAIWMGTTQLGGAPAAAAARRVASAAARSPPTLLTVAPPACDPFDLDDATLLSWLDGSGLDTVAPGVVPVPAPAAAAAAPLWGLPCAADGAKRRALAAWPAIPLVPIPPPPVVPIAPALKVLDVCPRAASAAGGARVLIVVAGGAAEPPPRGTAGLVALFDRTEAAVQWVAPGVLAAVAPPWRGGGSGTVSLSLACRVPAPLSAAPQSRPPTLLTLSSPVPFTYHAPCAACDGTGAAGGAACAAAALAAHAPPPLLPLPLLPRGTLSHAAHAA